MKKKLRYYEIIVMSIGFAGGFYILYEVVMVIINTKF